MLRIYQKYLDHNLISELFKNVGILGMHSNELHNAFDVYKFQKHGYNNISWIGTNICGPSVVVCKNLLESEFNVNARVYTNKQGVGKNMSDHTFMELDNGVYVDPTYRQFLKEPFTHLSPIFVGTGIELAEKVRPNVRKINDVQRWDKDKDITEKVDKFIKENFYRVKNN